MEVASGEYDVVAAVLGHELDALEVVLLDELAEVSVDDLLVDGEAVLAEVGDLLHHGGDHVHAVEDLQVDVKVRGHVTLLLLDLVLEGLLELLGVVADALSQALLQLGRLAHVHEQGVALVEQAEAEGGEADLHDGSVVQDLVRDLLLRDDRRQAGLHYQVLRFEVLLVDGQVVGLQHDGLQFELQGGSLQDQGHEVVNQLGRGLGGHVELGLLLGLEGLGLLVEGVTLVVDVLQLDHSDTSQLLLVFELAEEGGQRVALLEEQALVTEAVHVVQSVGLHGLESLQQLLVELLDEGDDGGQDLGEGAQLEALEFFLLGGHFIVHLDGAAELHQLGDQLVDQLARLQPLHASEDTGGSALRRVEQGSDHEEGHLHEVGLVGGLGLLDQEEHLHLGLGVEVPSVDLLASVLGQHVLHVVQLGEVELVVVHDLQSLSDLFSGGLLGGGGLGTLLSLLLLSGGRADEWLHVLGEVFEEHPLPSPLLGSLLLIGELQESILGREAALVDYFFSIACAGIAIRISGIILVVGGGGRGGRRVL
mmetsp:Transcript_30561/g.46858  ORF Transcript_30561/g.46858 Transcript_30561/m.46858 type:complete len:536 (-) Transcript_30561:788-2395(-)